MVSRVNIIGLGMGNPSLLTRDAAAALEGSELVIGSSRLLEALGETQARTVALVSPSAIAQELASAPERQASVVVSGDVGFYSGATALYEQLSQMELEVYPVSRHLNPVLSLCAPASPLARRLCDLGPWTRLRRGRDRADPSD